MKKAVAPLFVGFILLMSGCGSDNVAEKAVEQVTGVKVDQKGNDVSISSKDGQIAVSSSEKVPDDFPLPIIPQSKLESSIKSSNNGVNTYILYLTTSKDTKEVSSFYESAFKDKALQMQKTELNDNDSKMIMLTGTSDTLEANIQINTGDGNEPTQLNIAVNNKLK